MPGTVPVESDDGHAAFVSVTLAPKSVAGTELSDCGLHLRCATGSVTVRLSFAASVIDHVPPFMTTLWLPGLRRVATPSETAVPSMIGDAVAASGCRHDPPGWHHPVGSCSVTCAQFSVSPGITWMS